MPPGRAAIAFVSVLVALAAGCSGPSDDAASRGGQPFAFTRSIRVRQATTHPAQQVAAVTTAPAPDPQSDEGRARAAFEVVAKELGRTGVYRTPLVYTVTVPRDDVSVVIEGMDVPTAAGIESTFHFYWCPCGKTCVVGEFCVLEHEANDVIDALRAAKIEVASVAPMLLHARQRPTLVRFFAEGKPEPIAKAVREGLRWTGKERMAPVVPLRAE
ncbi:MAG TPA: DUF1259 domain-containing protein [Humisphaera sp.]